MSEIDDIEELRLETLRDIMQDMEADSEAEVAARYAPGGFGCHEALHTASVAMDLISGHILEHPAIVTNSEWFRLANEAHSALFALYQAIGQAHLSVTENGEANFHDNLEMPYDTDGAEAKTRG